MTTSGTWPAGRDAAVTRAVVALDITDDVIAVAAELGAELIVSHHPLIFGSIKSVTDGDLTGRKLVALLGRGMSAICMHTNLDAAQGGVNDALAAALGAQVQGVLNSEEWISRIAELPEAVEFGEFLSRVKLALGANGLRYAGPGRPVKRIGLCGGAGGGGYVPGARARLRHPMSPRTSSTTSSSPPTSWASTWWTAGISPRRTWSCPCSQVGCARTCLSSTCASAPFAGSRRSSSFELGLKRAEMEIYN